MILVTGASGLLGSVLVPQLRLNDAHVLTHACHAVADCTADLTCKDETFLLLDRLRPRVIVNLVGLTNVERCQEYLNESYLINTRTVENLADWIREADGRCHLVQISTDQVYDGYGEHSEDQITLTNNYAFSKYAGELAALGVPSTILRTNFFGRSRVPNRESFTDWIFNSLVSGKGLKVFRDVYFSPLSMSTLVEMIALVVKRQPLGVYNLGSNCGMSKAEFAFAFADALGLPTSSMTRIDSNQAEFLKAYRPKDMRMDSAKFEQELCVNLPNLLDQITMVAKEYK